MQTSVAPISQASFTLSAISSMDRKYALSSPSGAMKLQNPQYVLQIFVKLIFLLTTYVTTSPTSSFLISSAVMASAESSSGSVILKSSSASLTEISSPESALLRILPVVPLTFPKMPSSPRLLFSSIRSTVSLICSIVYLLGRDVSLLVHGIPYQPEQIVVYVFTAYEFGIYGQSLPECKTHILYNISHSFELRPRGFRVDVIYRNRGHASQVVYARVDEQRISIGIEVRRNLYVHPLPEYEPRDRHYLQHVDEIGRRVLLHGYPLLRAEILNDYFLNMTERVVELL